MSKIKILIEYCLPELILITAFNLPNLFSKYKIIDKMKIVNNRHKVVYIIIIVNRYIQFLFLFSGRHNICFIDSKR